MSRLEELKQLFSPAVLIATITYCVWRTINYCSYVSNFGAGYDALGFVSNESFVAGANIGVIAKTRQSPLNRNPSLSQRQNPSQSPNRNPNHSSNLLRNRSPGRSLNPSRSLNPRFQPPQIPCLISSFRPSISSFGLRMHAVKMQGRDAKADADKKLTVPSGTVS